MDYFSVIILIIVVFIFISDRKIKSIDILKKENNNITKEIENIFKDLRIEKVNTENLDYSSFLNVIRNSDKEYILVQNNLLTLTDDDIKVLLANYINSKKRLCGFNLLYSSKEKGFNIKNIYIDIINYLNIFNKKDISTYGVIICKRRDANNRVRKIKNEIISYIPSDFVKVHLQSDKLNNQSIKKIYINKLSKGNLKVILKLFLLIISGSFITTNLIYSIINVQQSITRLIISIIIYYCYSYIIKYVYTPIGKQRLIASYIFPIYFMAYIIVAIYTVITKRIKKVHAS